MYHIPFFGNCMRVRLGGKEEKSFMLQMLQKLPQNQCDICKRKQRWGQILCGQEPGDGQEM